MSDCDRGLRVLDIALNPVAKEYLPAHSSDGVFSGVKVDLALGYHASKSENPLLDIKGNQNSPLCPLEVPLQKMFLGCVPVKVAMSITEHSETQISVFGCAMLQVVEKWISTQLEKSKQDPPAVVALFIHGHYWEYYIVCRKVDVQNGNETVETPFLVYGPWPAGQTSTLLGVFRLVRFIDVLRNWIANKWLKWFETATGNES